MMRRFFYSLLVVSLYLTSNVSVAEAPSNSAIDQGEFLNTRSPLRSVLVRPTPERRLFSEDGRTLAYETFFGFGIIPSEVNQKVGATLREENDVAPAQFHELLKAIPFGSDNSATARQASEDLAGELLDGKRDARLLPAFLPLVIPNDFERSTRTIQLDGALRQVAKKRFDDELKAKMGEVSFCFDPEKMKESITKLKTDLPTALLPSFSKLKLVEAFGLNGLALPSLVDPKLRELVPQTKQERFDRSNVAEQTKKALEVLVASEVKERSKLCSAALDAEPEPMPHKQPYADYKRTAPHTGDLSRSSGSFSGEGSSLRKDYQGPPSYTAPRFQPGVHFGDSGGGRSASSQSRGGLQGGIYSTRKSYPDYGAGEGLIRPRN